MKRLVMIAAVAAMALGSGHLQPATAADSVIIVDTVPISRDLASHLRVTPDKLPRSVELPDKLAAVVCKVSLKQLRDSRGAAPKGNCVAVGLSQGLIDAVRLELRK